MENDYFYSLDVAYAMNYLNTPSTEVPFHEISHNFDNPKWVFEAEALANLKVYYYYSVTGDAMGVAGHNQIWRGKEFKNYMKSYANRIKGHINYDAAMAQNVYSPYSLAYNLGDIADKIGWEPYKKTFAYFESLEAKQVPKDRLDKLNLFLSKLKDFSGKDIFAMLNTKEYQIYENYFGGKIQYVTLQDIKDNKKISKFSDTTVQLTNISVDSTNGRIKYSMKVNTDDGYTWTWTDANKAIYKNPSYLHNDENIIVGFAKHQEIGKI